MSANQHANLPADEVIRSFLLGRLHAAAQEEFEARLMTDDQLHERVRQAELELADDLAGERIDRFDRQLLVRNFLLTDERRQMVGVSDALHQKFAPARAPRQRTPWPEMFRQPTLRIAFGVLVALLLVGSLLIATKQTRIVRLLVPKRAPARPAPISLPQEANHPTNQAPPVHRESEAAPLEHESTPPSQTIDVVLTLSPASDPNQAPSIALPGGGSGVIRCQLTLSRVEAEEFQVELWTQNQNVFVIDSVKPDANQLDVDIPVRVLKSGNYEVRVSRTLEGSKVPFATYYFRVQ